MKQYSQTLLDCIRVLVTQRTELHRYHTAMVAQWILESDRGFSHLAVSFKNFAGIKYRDELFSFASPEFIKVPSEPAPVQFAKFPAPYNFVHGYIRFLKRSPYIGWDKTPNSEAFIEHIGKVWAEDPRYIRKVKALFNEANEIIASIERGTAMNDKKVTWWEIYKAGNGGAMLVGYAGSTPMVKAHCKDTEDIAEAQRIHGSMPVHNVEVAPEGKRIPDVHNPEPTIPPGTSEPEKPEFTYERSPNQSSRNGVPIKRIVLHYTTSSNPQGTISWFKNPASRVSAHYMVGRDGKIWQFVNDDKKAWHAAGHNADSIGVENVAAVGQKLTAFQEAALVKLLKYLMSEYKIPKSGITGHKWLPNSTSCPGSLWETEAALAQWVEQNL